MKKIYFSVWSSSLELCDFPHSQNFAQVCIHTSNCTLVSKLHPGLWTRIWIFWLDPNPRFVIRSYPAPVSISIFKIPLKLNFIYKVLTSLKKFFYRKNKIWMNFIRSDSECFSSVGTGFSWRSFPDPDFYRESGYFSMVGSKSWSVAPGSASPNKPINKMVWYLKHDL